MRLRATVARDHAGARHDAPTRLCLTESVRLSRFWELMTDEFGAAYAHTLAGGQTLTTLSGRTPAEALEDGVDPRDVWEALCDHMDVPSARRLGVDRPDRP